MPTEDQLFAAVDASWPAHRTQELGGWTLREGRGGGQRVSAASGEGDIAQAEAAMEAMGQDKLFMIRGDQSDLDQELAARGYVIKDPVDLLVGSARDIAQGYDPKKQAIFTGLPMAILTEIWAAGGIGPERINVMERASCAKSYVLGRLNARAAAAAFVGNHDGVTMAHAVEVLAPVRRNGMAESMMRAAAGWGVENGAEVFAVLATQANTGAQSLYRKMGMETATQYHYRINTP
ncbi:GNAT family N-acetyltransferase [Neptunicoccus cionae]|uniref:N-acetyltransferase n=1 Tax=Neptunicoccus cionae TaxID=2035344 RepID=A0A916QX46_9RHOB|nr:GNAT family N-acetyltransferase [Amylibacter cionae]GGA18590.1 N-acetyltransferase [Amylibacter cionae]